MAVDDRQMSLLPTGGTWPPPRYNPITYQMRIWDAWYSGDPQKLAYTYYNLGANSPAGRSFFSTTGEPGLPTPRPGQFRGGLLGSISRFFWGSPTPPGEKRSKLHVPLAGDIAQTSSDLLFSEAPVVSAQDSAAQEALEDLFDDGMHATLLEAAELAAALGGVYLRVVWDTDIAALPWIDVVPVDTAVPTFSYNKLTAVTFWRVLSDSGSEVVRHLETHVPGDNAILHGVYVGDQTDLGRLYPLTDFPETAPLAGELTEGNAIVFPDQPKDASTVVYVPNVRPNRIWRDLGPQAAPLGRSDYQGVEQLMDALDETYSAWQRDIQLAKARLLVPQQYLDNIGKGRGTVFDPDRQVFTGINMMGNPAGGTSDIVANQFQIRWQEHQSTAADLVNRIVQGAGYSGQTFGEYDSGSAMTATEIKARERRSLITRDKKILYWRPGLRDIFYGWLAVAGEMFGLDAQPERPDIDFADVVLPDQLELAQTAQALAAAEAASKQTLVQMVHPDWTPDEVSQEVAQIYEELGSDLAARARLTIAAPPTASISEDVGQLAEAVTPPTFAGQPPGDNDEGE